MVRLFSCRIPPSLLRQRAWEKNQRGTENSPAPCASDRYWESSRRESARCRSLAGSVVCSAAIRFCPLCEDSISTTVKSVSSNRPGANCGIVSLLSGSAGSSLARWLALWGLRNDSQVHCDEPRDEPNEFTVIPPAPSGAHRLAL